MGLCSWLGESSVGWGMLPCPQGCHTRGDAVPAGMPCPWGCHAHLGAVPVGWPCLWRFYARKDAVLVVVLYPWGCRAPGDADHGGAVPMGCCARSMLALCEVCWSLLQGRVISVIISWNCNLDLSDSECHPCYCFHHLHPKRTLASPWLQLQGMALSLPWPRGPASFIQPCPPITTAPIGLRMLFGGGASPWGAPASGQPVLSLPRYRQSWEGPWWQAGVTLALPETIQVSPSSE